MKSLPNQERALKKRVELIRAAQALFALHGYELTTAETIAKRANVAKGTFYQYFDNKQDMLRVIANQRFSQLDTLIAQIKNEHPSNDAFEDLIFSILNMVYQFHKQEAGLHLVLEQRRPLDSELNDILSDGEALVRHQLQRLIQSELQDRTIDRSVASADAPQLAEVFFSMGEGVIHRLAFDTPECSEKQANELLKTSAKVFARYFK